jgi:iron complex outermembrane receptor protein
MWGAATLGWAGAAFAQTPAPTAGVEEIVVTAERRAANVQDVPLAVTAVTGEELDARGVATVADLAQVAPSLVLKPTTGTYTSGAFFIRGIGQKSVFNTFDPGVGLYIDDVYVGRSSFGIRSIYDLDRVEVLRGPQGTLYGRNSTGGAIKIVTARPGPDTEGRVEASYGNFDRLSLNAAGGAALADGVYVRGSGSLSTQGEGFTDLTVLGGTGNKADESGVRGALRFEPNDKLDWTISADWQKIEADGRYGATLTDNVVAGPDGLLRATGSFSTNQLDRSNSPIRAFNNAEEWGASSNLKYDFGGVTLTSITSFRDFEVDLSLDANNGGFAFAVQQNGDQLTQELQLSGESDALNWVAGLYYFKESSAQVVNLGLPLLGLQVQRSLSDVETTAYAAYAQATFSFAPNFRGTLGGRYSHEEKDVDATTFGFGGGLSFNPAALRAAGRVTSISDESFTPKAGLEFDWNDNVLSYVSYSQGFKAGGFQSTAGTSADFVPFAPEEVTTFEAGLKSELFDRRLRLNLAGFFNDYTDIQLDTLLPSGSIVQLNVAAAEVLGLEAEFEARVTDSLKFYGFVSLIDDEITEVAPTAAALGVRVGSRLNDIAQVQASLGGAYTWTLSGLGELEARATWTHSGDVFNTVTPPHPIQLIDSYDLVDARLRLNADAGWFAQLECDNCFDERYYTSRLSFAPGYPAIANTPRLFAVRVGAKF